MTQEFYGKDLARYKLERAREELDTAELLFENERLKAANNRAYYSIYYSLTAVLCLEPIAFKKHKDMIGYFNKNYVHTDRFPREIGRNISKAAKIRHIIAEYLVAMKLMSGRRYKKDLSDIIGILSEQERMGRAFKLSVD